MTYQPKLLQLIIEPDPLLHQVSQPIADPSQVDQFLIEDMIKTMHANDGIGLAAIQIGVVKRLFVMDINDELTVFVNPEIIERSPELVVFSEGCLSLPTIRADITRHDAITVKFFDRWGTVNTRIFSGLSSICIQHELDHLNGITFLDHLSKLKRDIFLKKLQKLRSQKSLQNELLPKK